LYKKSRRALLCGFFLAQNKEKEPVCAADRLFSIQIIAYRTPVILLDDTNDYRTILLLRLVYDLMARAVALQCPLLVLDFLPHQAHRNTVLQILLQLEMQGLTNARRLNPLHVHSSCFVDEIRKKQYTQSFLHIYYTENRIFPQRRFFTKLVVPCLWKIAIST